MVTSGLYQRSSALFRRASEYIPGGVNSPVRAFKSVGGDPIFLKSAKGAYLVDEDDREYIDYICSWGPMILGHCHPDVTEAIREQALSGITFGAPTELEIQMAELICSMTPGVDKVRMVNSGTEACMSAIRLARGYTGKDKIIKFAGNYHGHADSFLIKAGSGAVTLGHPSSPGVTKGTAADTLLANYNDLESVQGLVNNNRGEIAALILEPVAGNMGCIPPAEGFLQGLRDICDEHGIVLIFDEVMIGFRLARGGAQELYGIAADLVTYGKVIGGGMPVGAFGGRKEIFEFLAPTGPVYQAGTLSGNPIAMRSGLTTLTILNEHPEIYALLAEAANLLEDGLADILAEKGLPYTINRVGSMISVHFCENEVVDFETAGKGDNEHFKKFFHGMLARGIYLPPSAYESWFLSKDIGHDERERTLEAARETVKSM